MKWDPRVPADWLDEVAGWKWQPWEAEGATFGWQKWGPCPRCGHTMAVYQESLDGFSSTNSVRVYCNCENAHDGRPEAYDCGCGPGSQSDLRIAPAQVSR
jgi:hypothetical protein